MSRHSRLQVDERVLPSSPSSVKAAGLVPKHRRVVSDISSRNSQVLQEPIPELLLPGASAPQDDVNERRTLQTQWAEALQKVQSLGSHSSRWSGVATDLGRPKSMTSATTRTLDQWNFYPGPSIKGDIPDQTWKSAQVGAAAPDQTRKSTQVRASPDRTWKSTQVAGASPDQTWKSNQVGAAPDQTWKSQVAGAGPDQTWKSSARRGGEGMISSSSGGYRNCGVTAPLEDLDQPDQTRTSPSQYARAANSTMKGHGSRSSRKSSVSTVIENLETDQTWKPTQVGPASGYRSQECSLDHNLDDVPEQLDQVPSRLVHRTQSQRYVGGTARVDARVLNKAVSMREGGAHADAVLEMAHAYSATMCGLPLALQCASCGRSLGVIVQGNPGVDVAFCSACRPPEVQWKKKKKMSGIVSICKKLFRLERKN